MTSLRTIAVPIRALIAVALAMATTAHAAGQIALLNEECGLVLTPDQAAQALQLQRLGAYDPLPTTEAPLHVAFSFHVVRRSNGSGGLSQSRLDQAVADVNAHFAPEIQFCQPGATIYIDDNFWYGWRSGATANGLRSINPVPGTINVYFTPNGPCGISSFTYSPVQGIVMHNNCTATPTNHSTFTHEVGHYFDLFHTHETAFGTECTSGSNCASAGDLVCDTPADPRLSGLVSGSCQYVGSVQPPCAGDPPYVPSTRNLMSYSIPSCRDRFTQQQHIRAVATLVNLRPELDLMLCNHSCFADCDQSTGVGVLDLFDFLCFQSSFVNSEPYACDCDTSTGIGVCDIFDFLCFQNAFVGGCP